MSGSDLPLEGEEQGLFAPILLEGLLELSGLLVTVLDTDGRIRLFNSACESVTGYAAQEVLGHDVFEMLVPADEVDVVRGVADQLMRGESRNEHTNHWRRRDGSTRLIHWRNGVLRLGPQTEPMLLATGIDITFREEAELALFASRQRLQALVDAFPGPALELDRDYRILYSNWGYRAWFDVDAGAKLGLHVRDVIGHYAFEQLRGEYDRALAGRQGTYHGVLPYARGGPRFVHGNYLPRRDDQGNVTGLYAIELDLTQLERLRNQLSTETRRSRTVIENAIDAILVIDEQGIIQSANPAVEQMLGYRPSALISRSVAVLMPEPDRNRHEGYLRRYVETGEARIIGGSREVVGLHKDGHRVEMRLTVAEITEEGRRLFIGFMHDISAQKLAERKAKEQLQLLARLDRRAAMNELTADIAHELSQPLAAIRTATAACQRLQATADFDSELFAEALTQIAAQADRASDIIGQVRAFLRGGEKEQPMDQDLCELIDHVLPLLQHEMQTHTIVLRREGALSLPRCRINRVQIQQVVFNLVRNAIEAMAETAADHILTLSCEHDAAQSQCVVTVADTGPGIPEENLDRIFDAYFTTRETGLGQGLAICRSIIEQHGGQISVTNAPGSGAVFRFTLPCSEEDGPADDSG